MSTVDANAVLRGRFVN